MKTEQNNCYITPRMAVISVRYCTVICTSTGSQINDLSEDDTTLSGLFD